jgi:YHS domain-containing protein
MVRDVVCGMELDPDSAPAETEYNGEIYYFCSEECKQDFEKSPERYTGQPSSQRIGRDDSY